MNMNLPSVGLLMTAMIGAHADDGNYCNDPAATQEWAGLLASAPNDTQVIKLFALRTGLCALVEQGRLSVERATEIFEAERLESVIRRGQEQEERARKANPPPL